MEEFLGINAPFKKKKRICKWQPYTWIHPLSLLCKVTLFFWSVAARQMVVFSLWCDSNALFLWFGCFFRLVSSIAHPAFISTFAQFHAFLPNYWLDSLFSVYQTYTLYITVIQLYSISNNDGKINNHLLEICFILCWAFCFFFLLLSYSSFVKHAAIHFSQIEWKVGRCETKYFWTGNGWVNI